MGLNSPTNFKKEYVKMTMENFIKLAYLLEEQMRRGENINLQYDILDINSEDEQEILKRIRLYGMGGVDCYHDPRIRE